IRGRGFNDTDGAASAPVIVISEFTARPLFGTAAPVGARQPLRRAPLATHPVTVIGVTRDTDVRSLNGPRRPLVFVPLQQHFDRAITISARAVRGGDGVAALREAIRKADPDIGVDVVGRGRALLWGPFEIARSAGKGAPSLGAFTLLLSMCGLFGVQSHLVTYRTLEFGV